MFASLVQVQGQMSIPGSNCVAAWLLNSTALTNYAVGNNKQKHKAGIFRLHVNSPQHLCHSILWLTFQTTKYRQYNTRIILIWSRKSCFAKNAHAVLQRVWIFIRYHFNTSWTTCKLCILYTCPVSCCTGWCVLWMIINNTSSLLTRTHSEFTPGFHYLHLAVAFSFSHFMWYTKQLMITTHTYIHSLNYHCNFFSLSSWMGLTEHNRRYQLNQQCLTVSSLFIAAVTLSVVSMIALTSCLISSQFFYSVES